MREFEKYIEELAQKLKQPLPGFAAQQKMSPSHRSLFEVTQELTKAAVLILLYPDNSRPYIVLIKRTAKDEPHGGQISFPGGRKDDTDKSLEQTAIRECYEEIGVLPKSIHILGALSPLFIPVSHYEVFPYIGWIETKPKWQVQQEEVAYCIEIPVSELHNPQTIQIEAKDYKGLQVEIPYFSYKNEKIWGATAMMLSEFIAL
jgi:8-oxo-dGTP pyrophosphatase MutT (NUDIX family)